MATSCYPGRVGEHSCPRTTPHNVAQHAHQMHLEGFSLSQKRDVPFFFEIRLQIIMETFTRNSCQRCKVNGIKPLATTSEHFKCFVPTLQRG